MSHIDTNFSNDYLLDGYDTKKEREMKINWIVKHVKGNTVLDAGCSQGEASILLAREGKRILGMDISSSNVSKAKAVLQNEDKDTQNNVVFVQSSLFNYKFSSLFDTVILKDVIIDIFNIETLFQKASSLLSDKGRIIVTAPFGININLNNSKRLVYVSDFLKMQHSGLSIEKIDYFGTWVGVIFEKSNEEKKQIKFDLDFLKDLESAFSKKEQILVKNKLNRNMDIDDQKDIFKKYLDEKVEKVKTQKELYEQYKKEKELLNAYKKLKKEHEILLKNYKNVKNKYDKIRKSLPGRIGYKLWKVLKGKGRK